MSAVLSISGLCAGYGGANILEGIHLELQTGQFLGLLGANGSGKTTLLRCIAGSLSPAAGTLAFAQKQKQRNVACVSSAGARPTGFTAMQFTLLGRYPWLGRTGFYRRGDRECAAAALAAAGASSLAGRRVETLSEGQWQLVSLARGLCQIWNAEQPLLLLDEPAANLDLNNAMTSLALLAAFLRKGWAIIAAIHDCNLAAIFCTHLMGIRNGQLLFYGTVAETFTSENIGELYDWPVGIFMHPDFGTPQIYGRARAACAHELPDASGPRLRIRDMRQPEQV